MNVVKLILLFLIDLSILAPSLGRADIDITDRVVRYTDLDETIARLCAQHCQGNRREGRLRRMAVQRTGINTLWVYALASLKNHHHQNAIIGGGFAVYNFTVDVEATGTLVLNNCMLTIDDIAVSNDQTGLLNNLASGEIGKTHRIENCAAILDGI